MYKYKLFYKSIFINFKANIDTYNNAAENTIINIVIE